MWLGFLANVNPPGCRHSQATLVQFRGLLCGHRSALQACRGHHAAGRLASLLLNRLPQHNPPPQGNTGIIRSKRTQKPLTWGESLRGGVSCQPQAGTPLFQALSQQDPWGAG